MPQLGSTGIATAQPFNVMSLPDDVPNKSGEFIFEGQVYRDDRMFVLHVAPCTVRDLSDELIDTTVHHEKQLPAGHLWCLITYRNTERYPATRVDHFQTREEAEAYRRSVEPGVPRVSLRGQSPQPEPSYEEFLRWKREHGCEEYDYRRMFSGVGTNAHEGFTSRRRKP